MDTNELKKKERLIGYLVGFLVGVFLCSCGFISLMFYITNIYN